VTRQRRVHAKPILHRRAIAEGEIALTATSRAALRAGTVDKGDPIAAGELAGLLALKRTHELIPHCHPIPITGSSVEIRPTRGGAKARVVVEALWRTGVEMEALVGVSVALLTVWDMVKYLEKDGGGGYPTTRIHAVRVVEKRKEEPD
jgi:cyclic pyranopterin monophosphate synthase